jgi:hypothetical protein
VALLKGNIENLRPYIQIHLKHEDKPGESVL